MFTLVSNEFHGRITRSSVRATIKGELISTFAIYLQQTIPAKKF